MSDAVVVIGAGIGGLSAAVNLAAGGQRVVLLEAAAGPGGKAGVEVVDGVEVDTGPSVLTLPDVFDRIFRRAGTALAEQVGLRQPTPAFRYHYPDGVVLDVQHTPEDTLASVKAALGADPARELAGFLDHARKIWDAGAPNFVYGPAPSMGSLLRMGVTRFSALRQIDGLRSMWSAITKHVRSSHLQWLLARYATYNGSDVTSAPATLSCIAWVELGLGGFGVEGGIHALVRALERVALGLGVELRYDTQVTGLRVERGAVRAVETASGAVPARAVVCNADVAQLAQDLLPPMHRRALSAPSTPSMSGYTAVYRARRPAAPRPAHAVLFPTEYIEEFTDIFRRDRAPRDPTVYLCAQEPCHGRPGWPDAEPLFVMANAPAEPATGPRPREEHEVLAETVRRRLLQADLLDEADARVWSRTPTELAARFPGSRGAIYGAASNSTFAAFGRPPNRVGAVPGLYLASGSAHPGGGLPLCALSGLAAADACLEDLGPARRWA